MIIEVNNNVFWDSESNTQSDDFNIWFNDNVRTNSICVEHDDKNRPFIYHYENEYVNVYIKNIYINNKNFALKKRELEILKKIKQ